MSRSPSDDSSMADLSSYSQRSEWKDVNPIYLNDAETAVVNIAYSDRFREVFAYFRAILNSGEKSDRVLLLTTEAAWLNPANYTLWQYRRAVLQELKKDFHEELKFVSELIEEHPKNYQLWHHRRVIIETIRDASKELDFTAHMLRDDAKNYHAWQHRQWVVKEFNFWEKELDFVNKAIADDLRNNSAWNYRYFVVSSTTGYTPEMLENETRLCMELIRKAPHNESAWNYLSGILEQVDAYSYPGVWTFCTQLAESGCKAPYLLVFMIDCLVDQAEKVRGQAAAKSFVDEGVKLCDELIQTDPVRKGYYTHLKEKLLQFSDGSTK